MRWKLSHNHDPRLVDLLAVIVIVMTIAVAWFYFIHQFWNERQISRPELERIDGHVTMLRSNNNKSRVEKVSLLQLRNHLA